MFKQICLLILVLSVTSIDIGSVVNSITSGASDATSSVTDALNTLVSQSQTIVNQATSTIKNTSNTVVNEAKTQINSLSNTAVNTVNLAVQAVKDQVNTIVDTIDNLSAQMCQSQCTNFFNLPCFLMFRCTTKIRNFCLAVLLPIAVIIILTVGCSTGLITFPCCCECLLLLSGCRCLIWLIKSRSQKKQKKEQKDEKQEKDQKQGNNDEQGDKDYNPESDKHLKRDHEFHAKQVAIHPKLPY